MRSYSVAPRRAPGDGASPAWGGSRLCFRSAVGPSAHSLAHPLDSSVRVSRRVERLRDVCTCGSPGGRFPVPRLGPSEIGSARPARPDARISSGLRLGTPDAPPARRPSRDDRRGGGRRRRVRRSSPRPRTMRRTSSDGTPVRVPRGAQPPRPVTVPHTPSRRRAG